MKKIFLIMFCIVLLVGTVSALDFLPVKNYDEETKTVLVSNFLGIGRDVSTIQLKTNLIEVLPVGYQNVSMFEIDLFDDTYIDAFEKMVFINNLDGEVIERQFDYKYLTTEEKEIDIYENICNLNKNGTNMCSYEIVGTHLEYEKVWKDFDTKTLIKGKVTIGIFTNVNIGDNIEWIPTLFGKKINEWATFVQSSGTKTYQDIGGLNYTTYTFTSNGYFNVTGDTINVSVLVIAGGGGGASGGGGAGGLIFDNEFDVSAGDYNVFIGTGGTAGSSRGAKGGNGVNSSFSTLIAVGGGGAGYISNDDGTDGGSGGGGTGEDTTETFGGSGIVGQGNDGGGNGNNRGAPYASGGGGGAGEAGANASSDAISGDGGDGLSFTIFNGTALFYAGGGGGGASVTGTAGTGGVGGGGDGTLDGIGLAGTTNTGGGGGGSRLNIDTAGGVGGSGIVVIRYLTSLDDSPTVTLNTPINTSNITASLVNFGGIVTDNNNLINVSLIIDNVYIETNTSGINNSNYTFSDTLIDGDYTWTYEGCDNASQCSNGTMRSFGIDTINPAVKILAPSTIINYHVLNTNITFNWSANDTHLDTCIYEYERINTTVTCSDNTTNINITNSINRTITFYVNDTFGHMNSTSRTWNYNVFENSRTLNETSYQTQSETLSINVTANSTLATDTLDYNGTEHSTTKSGSIYSKTLDIPLASLGNNTIRWKFTYAGDNFYSDDSTQNISETVWAYCNATYTVPFFNVSFKDEADLSFINATIPTSNFIYYLGSGSVTKTYTYVNNTENYYYEFCATPNLTMSVNPYIQYKKGTDYPQRIYDADLTSYSNDTTDLTLYLLGTTDGIYVTFQVINTANLVLSGVDMSASREISGNDIEVGTGITGADGGVTLWLNPDFVHDFVFNKSGFPILEESFAPTQAAYTITLGGGVTTQDSYFRGMIYSVLPIDSSLTNDTSYTFGFNLTSSFWNLQEYGFDLRLKNGTIITGGSTSTSGTPLTKSYNTINQTKVYLDYYWLVNDTYTNGTRLWLVYNTLNTQWSIGTFFTDFNAYMDSGFFGIDDFGRYLIIFIVIFFSVGIMSYKFGFTSPVNISVMTFLIVFFFDVVVNIIPPLTIFSGTEVKYLLTMLTGLIAVMVVLREATRI